MTLESVTLLVAISRNFIALFKARAILDSILWVEQEAIASVLQKQ